MKKYITKDSGKREVYESGAIRDTSDDKLRWDLIPLKPLKRLAGLYTRGAKKYGDDNWKKGIPTKRFVESAIRHLMQYRLGEHDEDHLAAVVFNVFGIMFNEKQDEDDE